MASETDFFGGEKGVKEGCFGFEKGGFSTQIGGEVGGCAGVFSVDFRARGRTYLSVLTRNVKWKKNRVFR